MDKRTGTLGASGAGVCGGAALLLWCAVSAGQTAVMVADLNPGALATGPAGSAPSGLVGTRDKLFFAATGATDGVEPYVATATPLAAYSLGDLRPGPGGSFPSSFTALGEGAVFVADDGIVGAQLWWSDGTAAGTARITSFVHGVVEHEIAVRDGRAYFFAWEGASGFAMWSSDGTLAGTVRVAGVSGAPTVALPQGLVRSGSRFFFLNDDGVSGRQLWVSDGTPTGTTLVGPLVPPGLSSSAMPVAARLSGSDGVALLVSVYSGNTLSETQLWFADGSAPGSTMLLSIPAGGQSEVIKQVVGVAGGVLLVSTGGAGTFTGQHRISIIESRSQTRRTISQFITNAVGPVVQLGSVLFQTRYGNNGTGRELWCVSVAGLSSDRRVADLNTGVGPSDPSDLLVAPGGIYFSAYAPAGGTELYRAVPCGTAASLRAEIAPGARSSQPEELTLVGDTLFFRATGPSGGQELWAYSIPPAPDCGADFNGDGQVDADDLSDYITRYWQYRSGLETDVTGIDRTGDCRVGTDDYSRFILEYFSGC